MIIKHQRGRGNKVHLLLDDEYTVTTDINFWLDHYIPDGTDISEEEWEELLKEINYKKALNKCADLLSRREHSVKEVRDKLIRIVDTDTAQRAIDRYIESGYLDDRRFCEMLVEYLYKNKNYSKAHIKQECFKRGIASSITSEVLEDFEMEPVEQILDLLKTKYSSRLEQEKGKEKVYQALLRKGFTYSDISSAFYRFDDEEI